MRGGFQSFLVADQLPSARPSTRMRPLAESASKFVLAAKVDLAESKSKVVNATARIFFMARLAIHDQYFD